MKTKFVNNVVQQLRPEQQQFQVDLSTAKKEVCECGGDVFIQGVQIFIVSAIVSPNGQELVATPPALVCAKCKKQYVRVI